MDHSVVAPTDSDTLQYRQPILIFWCSFGHQTPEESKFLEEAIGCDIWIETNSWKTMCKSDKIQFRMLFKKTGIPPLKMSHIQLNILSAFKQTHLNFKLFWFLVVLPFDWSFYRSSQIKNKRFLIVWLFIILKISG